MSDSVLRFSGAGFHPNASPIGSTLRFGTNSHPDTAEWAKPMDPSR